MARWKLTEPHYLNVPGNRWEHNTNDVKTGKAIRKMYAVPKHLDPRVEDDWNHRVNGMDGEIHICYEGKGLPHDIIFEGDPTPGMLPLDDEAKVISAKYADRWTPTQGIDEESQRQSFVMKLYDKLFDQLDATRAAAASAPQSPGVEKLLEAMAAMMAQNQQMMAMLAGKLPAAEVEDELTRQAKALGETGPTPLEDEPLGEAEPTPEELREAAIAAEAKDKASEAKATGHIRRGRI